MQSVLFRTSFPVFIRGGRRPRRQFFPFFCRQTRRTEDLLELEQDPPDVVVAQLPPNYLAHSAARFKARFPETRLIFEIFDMWPETFPSGSMKRLLSLPFSVWAGLRD